MKEILLEKFPTAKKKLVVTTDVYAGMRFIILTPYKLNDEKETWEQTGGTIVLSKEEFDIIGNELKKFY